MQAQEISKIAGEMWRQLSDDEKKGWALKANQKNACVSDAAQSRRDQHAKSPTRRIGLPSTMWKTSAQPSWTSAVVGSTRYVRM